MEKVSLSGKKNHRYFAPKKTKEIPERRLKYSHAEDLAKDIDFNENERYFVFVNGTFFFGDFLEAWIVLNNIHVKKMTISTLSMNMNNVDSLANLINGNYVDELNLVLSDFFYAHEKHQLVPYILEQLDVDNKFQVAYAGTHCKLCTIETHSGRFYVFHGSANMRSSSNIEQMCFEENKDLYLWVDEVNDDIIKEYSTINKSVRGKKLWQVVKEEESQESQGVAERRQESRFELLASKKQAHHFKKIKF